MGLRAFPKETGIVCWTESRVTRRGTQLSGQCIGLEGVRNDGRNPGSGVAYATVTGTQGQVRRSYVLRQPG
eukprot:gene20844-biopygen6977